MISAYYKDYSCNEHYVIRVDQRWQEHCRCCRSGAINRPAQLGCYYTDYSPEEWGPEVPLSAPRYAVPMPTLYSTEGYRYKKPSVIEMLLYNMAAMLGGVAAGYDVRLSNVTPLHPRLQPYRSEVEPEPLSSGYEGLGYAHNTYHGPIRHLHDEPAAGRGPTVAAAVHRLADTVRARLLLFWLRVLGAAFRHERATHITRRTSHDPLADLYHLSDSITYPTPIAHRLPTPLTSTTSIHTPLHPRPRHYHYGRAASPDRDRPANLGLELAPTKLRSSLKKYKKSSGGGASGGSTPTNPTPPDSLASCPSASETDSSYVSARDTSGSSQSRVRFSPETMAERRHS
ncbi:hypothetical protein EVAR_6297_1 [Eumeta japonica]|uniref:Uncharacterized protein n=1 Tax=Eumeta variegata TaxID=151549 RepID=A0A4C1T8J9_EUMVA|nr:hypothetical protein EVAR_6297_1 [Eumeta japonica]